VANYIRNRATAERMIRQNGTTTQNQRQNNNVDPVTGKPVGPAEEEQDIYIVFLPAGTSGDAQLDQFKDSDGVLNLERLRKVLISTQGLQWNPEQGQLIKYQDEWWNYYGVGSLDPDGKTIILFKGYIRRI